MTGNVIMSEKRRVTAKAFASVANLGHGFDALGVAVEAGFDLVTVSLATSCDEIIVAGRFAELVPTEPARNTAGLAVSALRRKFEIESPIHMKIDKGIRCGSGMGSSAASAAAAVKAAAELFGLPVTVGELVAFAAEGERASAGTAHADNVAASLIGGFVVCAPDDACRVTRLTSPSASIRFVLALPDLHVPTEQARRAMPPTISLGDYSKGCSRVAEIVAAINSGDARSLGRAIEDSFVDKARGPLIPGFDDVCERARDAGAFGVTIGGAGPTVAAVVDDSVDADAVANAMQAGFSNAGLRSDTHVANVAGCATIVDENA